MIGTNSMLRTHLHPTTGTPNICKMHTIVDLLPQILAHIIDMACLSRSFDHVGQQDEALKDMEGVLLSCFHTFCSA